MEAANKVFEQAMEGEDDIVLPVTGNELKNIEKAQHEPTIGSGDTKSAIHILILKQKLLIKNT